MMIFAAFCGAVSATLPARATDNPSVWEGVWFSCEHAQRQRAPDDGCQMFDDEGFEYKDGILYYLRMKDSQQTDCKGNKKGQCFARDKKAIKVTKKQVADISIKGDKLIVRYWGCNQSYHLSTGKDYMTVKPDDKNCLWSQERHFYIARYEGQVSLYRP
ncbi:MAG: hypothetical protein ACON49_03600 [Candidatus Puniceispirillaceae bacterium]